ncbi:MAG: BspA family leucine-rich repeat surface protein [Acutalibacteraceae bacterium]
MFTSIKSRLISFFLVVALVFSLLFASAIPTNAASDISSSGGNGESKVVTTVAPSIFSVTVPYVLPISVAADGTVSVADNAAITNNSNGPIIVSSAEITAKNGWELVEVGTDFQAVPVNSKQLTLSMMGKSVDVSGSVDPSLFSSINGNSSLNISYDADAAVQGDALSNQNVADVLFTVEWDSYEQSGDVVSKTALNTFAVSNNLKTFQRTTENLNIDDVLADDRMVKIDNAPVVASGKSRTIASGAAAETEPVVYAWSDNNGNGYWWSNADKVYLPADCSGMFRNSKLTSLDLSNFDTSNVTNMSEMFSGCSKLTSLDLSNFDTSNVVDMTNMFSSCSNLRSLDLSSFNTSYVTSMYKMFYGCTKLTSLNLSNFDTSNVISMGYMFNECSNLTSLDLSSFNTINTTYMSGMFFRCNELVSLDLLSFNTYNVQNMDYMFAACKNLTSLNISSFNTSNVYTMSYMFADCNNLISLDLSGFYTNKATNMYGMFANCQTIQTLDLSSFITDNVKDMSHMFYYCNSLTTIYVSDFNVNNVTSGDLMFFSCGNLKGQNGTPYQDSFFPYTTRDDVTFARIDLPGSEGLFTYKAKTAA